MNRPQGPIQTNTRAPTPSRRRPPAVRRPPPPPRPTQPQAFAPLIASETDVNDNKSQVAFLRAKHKQLMDFLQAKFPDDRRTQTLRLNLTQIKMLPEYISRTAGAAAAGPNSVGYRVASFAYETGVLEVAPRDEDGQLRPKPKLLMSYLHEAGHCLDSFMPLPDDHGTSWRSHVLWLTNIATKELKWDVLLSCYYCDNYLVCAESQCPTCTWECPPDGQTPEVPALSKNSIPGFHKYSRDAYDRVCVKEDLPYEWWKGICTDYEVKNGLPRRQRTKKASEIATPKQPPPPKPPAKSPPKSPPKSPAKSPPPPKPCLCPLNYNPVCHDGKVFANDCSAKCAKPGAVTTPALRGADGKASCPPTPSPQGPKGPTCTCPAINKPVCAMPREGSLQNTGTLYTNDCLARCADPTRALYPPTPGPTCMAKGCRQNYSCPLPA